MLLNALVCVGCIAVCFVVFRFLFRVDEKIEDRRRAMAQLATLLANYGLKRLPEILIDYSVGDYSGMLEHVHDFVKLLSSGDVAVVQEFNAVFDRVLEKKLATDEGLAYLAAKIGEAADARKDA